MKLVDETIADYTQLLSSDLPAPGGGSAAALHGALGASLIGMVASLTVGRVNYAEHEQIMRDVIKRSNELREYMLEVIDRDTGAYNMVSAAFAMPKKTDEDKEARFHAMQNALKACTLTPYAIMECAYGVLELAMVMVGKYNTNASSDLGVAVLSIKTSAQSAWLNVLTNLDGIHDEIFSAKYTIAGSELIENITELADYIYDDILSRLSGGRFS
ncbi:MAG: cyclodeaminase/cyclohydrolase family protein [Oscillospiraceae bacterium]|nr:cyclodeaminase/cyclohydrolase family protein [Oscillospiraceae bacterium]